MTPRNPFDMLLTADIDRLVSRSKSARKAVAKASRKLAQARKAKRVTEIRVLLGMAQVALDKAVFVAQTGGGK